MLKSSKTKVASQPLFWLIIYLLLNTMTGNIASSIGVDPHIVGAVPNLLLAIICLFYLNKTQIVGKIGLFTKSTEKPAIMLFYIPVLILPLLNLFYGINKELSPTKILLLLAMYIGVGFMEEVIFRGLMFKELTQKWTDRTDKLHFRVSGGIRQSRITVLLSSWARAGRAGRRFRRAFFDARR